MAWDMRYCSNCGNGASGYGFVATVQGIDPCICPDCGQRTLHPISKLQYGLRLIRHKVTGKF